MSEILTHQQVFDKSARHLMQQKRRSVVLHKQRSAMLHRADIYKEQEICAYRGQNNLMCAIGLFIPDEKYTVALEGYNVSAFFGDSGLVRHLKNHFVGLADEHLDLLNELQDAHDFEENWTDAGINVDVLRKVATHFDLSPAVLDEVV